MPSKKKKYNARFPAGRIKKIMQTDEEIGKVAQAVPVIISRTLELFVESLLRRAMQITSAKNAKTLTPTHMKQCILSESRFDFLKDLVKGIPDVSSTEDEFGTPTGNLSPGIPLSAKAYSSYNCFQFHQSNDSSSSKSSDATSQLPIPQISQPKFYKEIPIGSENCGNKSDENSAPSFNETTVTQQHQDSSYFSNYCSSLPLTNKAEGNPSLLRTISGHNITQLNELKLSNCIKMSDYGKSASERGKKKEDEEDEEEEEEDEEKEEKSAEDQSQSEENGYHREANIAKTCIIDEDYDT